MKTREELEATYKKIWHIGTGAIDAVENFRIFLEEFLDFPKYGFFKVEKKHQGLGGLTYYSKSVWVQISPDFGRFIEMGGGDKFFLRSTR